MNNILVIDDNELFLDFIVSLLKNEGHAVVGFECLENALSHISDQKQPLNLILWDYLDDEENPVKQETVLFMRHKCPSARIIIMSACDTEDQEKIEKMIETKLVAGFLPKTNKFTLAQLRAFANF